MASGEKSPSNNTEQSSEHLPISEQILAALEAQRAALEEMNARERKREAAAKKNRPDLEQAHRAEQARADIEDAYYENWQRTKGERSKNYAEKKQALVEQATGGAEVLAEAGVPADIKIRRLIGYETVTQGKMFRKKEVRKPVYEDVDGWVVSHETTGTRVFNKPGEPIRTIDQHTVHIMTESGLYHIDTKAAPGEVLDLGKPEEDGDLNVINLTELGSGPQDPGSMDNLSEKIDMLVQPHLPEQQPSQNQPSA